MYMEVCLTLWVTYIHSTYIYLHVAYVASCIPQEALLCMVHCSEETVIHLAIKQFPYLIQLLNIFNDLLMLWLLTYNVIIMY